MKTTHLLLLFIIASCSHHHKDSAHHHHENCKSCVKDVEVAYEGKCAQTVLEGDDHVEGKEEVFLDHEGRRYFFSSPDKKDAFAAHLDAHVRKANTMWKKRQQRR